MLWKIAAQDCHYAVRWAGLPAMGSTGWVSVQVTGHRAAGGWRLTNEERCCGAACDAVTLVTLLGVELLEPQD